MCELCKSKFCGKSPCRRCECGYKRASEEATYDYGDYRRAARFPWPSRIIKEDILQEIEEEEEEEEEERRKKKKKKKKKKVSRDWIYRLVYFV